HKKKSRSHKKSYRSHKHFCSKRSRSYKKDYYYSKKEFWKDGNVWTVKKKYK
ncbi:spore gernimation protein GerQ, partial [Bacillus atrophaeus]|nr:spore gernimation protein GerQ [Bacillus atrophaeus]